jgi:hypothetical protein
MLGHDGPWNIPGTIPYRFVTVMTLPHCHNECQLNGITAIAINVTKLSCCIVEIQQESIAGR